MLVCWVLAFVAVLVVRDIAPAFLYDASQYWTGSSLVIDGRDPWLQGGLDIRGVLSSFVYLPATAAVAWFGASPGWAVLVQNAALVATIGAVVLPLLVGRVVRLRSRHVIVSTAFSIVLLSGFGPYPLMDLPAAGLLVLGVLLLDTRRIVTQMVGALCLGVAVNLRPAHLAAVALIVVVVAVVRRLRVIPVVAGVMVGLVPQTLYLRHHDLPTGIMPPSSGLVAQIQLNYAAYGVRYDTVAYQPVDPRQWFCDPSMAQAVGDDLPTSNGDLLSTFLHELPSSALFSLEKVTATLQWSTATPYAPAGTPGWTALGILAVLVVGAGAAALAVLWPNHGERSLVTPSLIAIVLGTAVTLVGASPETRFALPILLVGIVGCTVLVSGLADVGRRRVLTLAGAGCVLAGVVFVFATIGTSHPAAPGDVNADVCGAT